MVQARTLQAPDQVISLAVCLFKVDFCSRKECNVFISATWVISCSLVRMIAVVVVGSCSVMLMILI